MLNLTLADLLEFDCIGGFEPDIDCNGSTIIEPWLVTIDTVDVVNVWPDNGGLLIENMDGLMFWFESYVLFNR